ncbi:uncharacterized protein HMPREF1541_01156 [Cyphellophora europaea CBS 101466]|uniref:Uncharacterized protein n=1 Tax=Cyphellophora europaea (strain CBS 101466) TaxID=1220924 RepID=W2SE20_CYPE1|nr:uncharacterized protein HMPREF1541_01156 [Cyphellophora europaea CBS 101466]ETN46966.1 hypothetical protein HMPREF1541_01156 [Cyphellophora europaea CBS 101466]
MSGRGDARRGRRSPPPSDSEDESLTHIQCWIPAASIDLVVLAIYLKEFIDDTATIKPSPNPQDTSKQGYTIGARNTLSVSGCRDIIEDSRTWEKEKQSRDYRKDPYPYNDSDTWYNRRKKGASPGHTNPRRRRRPAGEVADAAARASKAVGARHRDPDPEPPPRPSNPPPDVLKESRIPKPGLETSMKKLSIATPDSKDMSRESLSKRTVTNEEPREEANRGARVQPNTSSTRHRDKADSDIRSTTTSGWRERDRHTVDDDDVRSTMSSARRDPRDRHRT